MRVGVAGAGSIGCYVGGALAAAGTDVILVGRERLRDELRAHGLTGRSRRGNFQVAPDKIRVETELEALAGCDAVLCCVKCGDTFDVGRRLGATLGPGAIVASLQNGLHNAEVLRELLPDRRIVPGVVGFNVVARGNGVFQQTTSGALVLPDCALVPALRAARLAVDVREDLVPEQWTKLLVNLNNAVSALSGVTTRELLLSAGYRRAIAAVVAEALGVLRTAKIRPASLRGMPVGMMPAMLRMPTALVRMAMRSQLDPEARSSMAEDLARGRRTEVEYLNGEIVRLAEHLGIEAPLNLRLAELVHDAEENGGSPKLSPDELWSALH
jgi:2-dehydropantoate 2-reductase